MLYITIFLIKWLKAQIYQQPTFSTMCLRGSEGLDMCLLAQELGSVIGNDN